MEPETNDASAGARILVVDDDATLARFMTEVLGDAAAGDAADDAADGARGA